MRATFINPRRRKSRKKASRRKRRNAGSSALSRRVSALDRKVRNMRMANPRRRRRRSTRRRRRNAGITPFIAAGNPYILNNPRRRRHGIRRRRNPGMGKINFSAKAIIDRGVSYGGGAALGTAANAFVLNGIKSNWLRNGARFGVAVFGGQLLRGDLGASAAGAVLSPLFMEVAAMLNMPLSTPDADLDHLAADLNDILSDDEYVW